MPKHTPGPWAIDDGHIITSTHLPDGPDDDIAEVYGGNDNDPEVREANARLIAAAPDLLALVRKFLGEHPCRDGVAPCLDKHCVAGQARALLGRIDA